MEIEQLKNLKKEDLSLLASYLDYMSGGNEIIESEKLHIIVSIIPDQILDKISDKKKLQSTFINLLPNVNSSDNKIEKTIEIQLFIANFIKTNINEIIKP